MALNPSSTLENCLVGCFPTEPESMERQYCLSSSLPKCLDRKIEHLRYIRYQHFCGQYSFATIQECKNIVDATRHWDTQKMHDERFLIHPQGYMIHQGKYTLIFPKFIRAFKVWVQEHAKRRVTDADIWEILMKIGENMIYLVESDRPHGNLLEGIGVTTDRQPLFFNLGADTDALIYQHDAQALLGILKNVEPNLQDLVIRERVNKWMSFLVTSCSGTSPPFLPHDYSPDHVKFVFNYPSFWDVENKLRFLANMYKLCTDIGRLPQYNLMNNGEFIASLRPHYSNWPAEVTTGVSALNEVYQFGVNKGLYGKQKPGTSTVIVSVASIVIFAHNCVHHHCGRVQNYNKVHGAHLRELISSEILTQLFTKFYYLIEHIYKAFYMALAVGGYTHPTFTVAQILTGRL